jgi:hypothetical protein
MYRRLPLRATRVDRRAHVRQTNARRASARIVAERGALECSGAARAARAARVVGED